MTIFNERWFMTSKWDVLCTGASTISLLETRRPLGHRPRRLFYEKDRMDTVDPHATVKLDTKILAQFPEGYKHFEYTNKARIRSRRISGWNGPGRRRMRSTRRGKNGSRVGHFERVVHTLAIGMWSKKIDLAESGNEMTLNPHPQKTRVRHPAGCQFFLKPSPKGEGRDTATCLSNFCAFLIRF